MPDDGANIVRAILKLVRSCYYGRKFPDGVSKARGEREKNPHHLESVLTLS